MITIICPGCQRELHIADANVGKTGRCKLCGEAIRAVAPTVVPAIATVAVVKKKRQKRWWNAKLPGWLDKSIVALIATPFILLGVGIVVAIFVGVIENVSLVTMFFFMMGIIVATLIRIARAIEKKKD